MSLRPVWWRAVCGNCQAESWVSTILPEGPVMQCPACSSDGGIVEWVKTEETLADPASMNLPPSFENSEQELRTNALVSIANSLLSLERLLENYL